MESKEIYKRVLLEIEAEINKALQVDPRFLDPIHCQNNVAVVISHHSRDKIFPLKIIGIKAKDFYKPTDKTERESKAL